MNSFKKVFSDPALYVLIILNLYFIYEYKADPSQYNTIVWLFWCQSVLIGLFNFFELLTTSNVKAGNFKMNDQPVDPKKGTGCYSWFFLFHYQFFHLVYFIFLATQTGFKNVDFGFFQYALIGLLVNQMVTFIRNKLAYAKQAPDLGYMFFLPYLRIIPMHFTILLPAFLNWEPAMIFLILKAVFDVVGHIITTRYYWKKFDAPPVKSLMS